MKIYEVNKVHCEEVIICTKEKKGDGKTEDKPIRYITQVFTKEGELIAEHDFMDGERRGLSAEDIMQQV